VNITQNEFTIAWVLRLPDEKADQVMVEMVAHEMRKKLAKKREDGRRGWFKPECSNEILMEMLKEHLQKPSVDMVDILNLAGMILARQKLYGEKT
jgi:hypothetical protein